MVVVVDIKNPAIKVYSNNDIYSNSSRNCNLPNQIRTKTHSGLYSIITNGKEKNKARFYCTSTIAPLTGILHPFFITGLTDAEGSFVCIIKKSTGQKLGWRVLSE